MGRIAGLLAVGGLVLTACSGEPPRERNAEAPQPFDAAAPLPEPSGPPVVQQAEAEPAQGRAEMTWARRGNVMRLTGPGRRLLIVIACRPGSHALLVHVPSFTPVGSEERLSLGLGEEPVTLVADLVPRQGNPGVNAEGGVPDNFGSLLAAANQITAHYGAQKVGPFPPVSAAEATVFAKGC